MTTALTRRHLLAAALAVGATVPFGAGRAHAAGAEAAPGKALLMTPPPTGPHPIGTVDLHLLGAPNGRELMASVWYPAAAGACRFPVAPWMPAAGWRALLDGVGIGGDAAGAPPTAGHEAAPVLHARDRLPVVLYSHGNDSCRAETTVVVQELASHGYVVVTVDHTGDGYSEFPDGRVAVPSEDSFTPWDSAHDMVFVLDRIEALAAGRNPDAGRRRLPAGLGAALDLRRVGMFGWSKGATSTAITMNIDPRVRAGLSLDGPMESVPRPVAIDRPFMLMTADFGRDAEPAVEEFWQLLRGWRLDVRAEGAVHGSYTDSQWLIPPLAAITGMSPEDLAEWVGTLDPGRAVRIQQAYPLAFFDLHLRNRRQRLLRGPSAAFPEVRFIR
ncbi:alpha/beta hydrolase family protein [Actinoplanes sp. CA-030573]|uniref:alpha/beta hydrolase family protein n=1 Tax=Actinoplanes sp. CA-030573 TaxID=3239898 RepID=UPI003D94E1D1